jgi:transcriptional regulator with XRE-family HTH domain
MATPNAAAISGNELFEMPGGSFGSNLKAARDRLGWGQEELGKRTGLNPATIYRLEIGDRQPRLPTILVLAEALGITGSDLIRNL